MTNGRLLVFAIGADLTSRLEVLEVPDCVRKSLQGFGMWLIFAHDQVSGKAAIFEFRQDLGIIGGPLADRHGDPPAGGKVDDAIGGDDHAEGDADEDCV